MAEFVFVDTSFFKALVDQKDDFHLQASKIWGKLKKENSTLVTSNFILDETFTLIRARNGLKKVAEFRNFLAQGSKNLKIMRVTVADEGHAWLWFEKNWTGLSFTDCVSFALMKRLAIKEAATFDRHFSRAKFKILT